MKNEKNRIELGFCVWDFDDITHDELTKILQISPSKIMHQALKKPKNGWFLDAEDCNNKTFEQQMNQLLDLLEPKIDTLKPICEKYHCEFSCAIFLFNKKESAPWIHLDKRYNDFIRQVNVEMDFDIYM